VTISTDWAIECGIPGASVMEERRTGIREQGTGNRE